MREYTIIDGDITKATDVDFIIHQVNCRGKMGSGVAKAIREKYPVVYTEYNKVCSSSIPSRLLGFTQYVQISKENKPYYVVNMFTQENFGYDGAQYTSLEAFKKSLENINKNCANYTVAFPWKIGCVRGGANWDEVLPLICKTLTDVKEIVFYRL